MARVLILLLALALASVALPSAGATLFAGKQKLTLEHSDSGYASAGSSHVYDDWVRSYAYRVDWSRVGVYELSRFDAEGASAFSGTGEEHREATGTLEINLDDQDGHSSLTCTLEIKETTPSFAGIVEYEGMMVLTAGRGMLDADAWDCVYGGNEVVFGSAQNVPLASYAYAGVEGLDAGTFPAELAVLLGFADSESEWADEHQKHDFAEELVRSGYTEAEPILGKQTIPMKRSFETKDDETFMAYQVCGDASVDETPSDGMSCTLDGEVTIELTAGGSTTRAPSGTNAPDAAQAAGAPDASPQADEKAGAPGIGAVALLGALAAVALVLRRRA